MLLGKILSGAIPFTAGLSQEETNGASLWGTLDAPTLPYYLPDSSASSASDSIHRRAVSKTSSATVSTSSSWSSNPSNLPWGSLTPYNANPRTATPNTGVTRYYDFVIARGKASPDGYQKDVLLVNGAFPGPLIEANWGDWIQVTVHNNITGPVEGTSFHWHGLLQKETPWYDGVPGVTQCPIAPGQSFTYRFRADGYGTSWYHSHYSAQYSGGLSGPMIFHGPTHVPYDIDLGPVMISDWYHMEYFKIVQGIERTLAVAGPSQNGWHPASDSNLINGKANFDCSKVEANDTAPCVSNAGLSKFVLTPGKRHRLRLINSGAEGLEYFAIDGHTLTVIANDFVPVQPYNTTVVTLGNGQRTDVIVTANQAPGAYWMRANMSVPCALTNEGVGLAAVYYAGTNTSVQPATTSWTLPNDPTCKNDDLATTVPAYSQAAKIPTVTQYLYINQTLNASGNAIWTVNNSTFRANFNKPILALEQQGNYTYPYDPNWNAYNFGGNTTIRLVLQDQTKNTSGLGHPMHLHGHDFQVLHDGSGPWDGTTLVNTANPQRRDTQMLRPGGHLVIQFDTDNPGVWSMHCHIAWHVSKGLYVNILERPQDVKQSQIPVVMKQTCDAWATYSANGVPEDIDSGL